MADIKPLTSALAALASAAMRRGRAWWLRRAGEALVVIAFLHATVFGCIPAFELGTNPNAPPATFGGPISDIHIIQARAEALDLLLSIYDALAEQIGTGPWTPPPESGQYQAGSSESEEPRCPGGTTREWYVLTDSSMLTINTKEAVPIVRELATPYGFVKDAGYGSFIRHTDEARIDIFDTGIFITTGCHTGKPFEGWPAGTEAVPDYLRTTGRAPVGGGGRSPERDTWPAQTPTAPVPAPPSAQEPPAQSASDRRSP